MAGRARRGVSGRSRVLAVVRQTPAVAAALPATRFAGGTLPELCGLDPGRFGPGGDVERWRTELTLMHARTPGDMWATSATSGVASAVALWTGDRPDPPALALATRNLLLLLPAAAPTPATAPALPSAQDVARIAAAVAAHLNTGR
ncbi:hypothetical protein OHA72_31675 [Dactylosporangium sp. NBC_01737]|uniref:hypothetical protein n=1 Tax=Dactylosporangium sp. NBC_01737 TaxID=2975959 RepID=UPI002E0D7ADC|nr:hypothetical protein OHA72_31675 [Dactylosporangium sp. NBC_01737]